MSDDISKVVALLREPPAAFLDHMNSEIFHLWIDGRPPVRGILATIADYLDQHARPAPEAGDESAADAEVIDIIVKCISGAGLIGRTEAARVALHNLRDANLLAAQEVSEPTREELIEALERATARGSDLVTISCTAQEYQRQSTFIERDLNFARSVLSRARRA